MNRRTAHQINGMGSLAILWTTTVSAGVYAETAETDWHVSVPLYITAGAHYRTTGNTSTAFESVAAAVEILLSSRARPYSAGLFYEYSHSSDQSFDGTVNTGVFWEDARRHWDATGYLFKNFSPGSQGLWAVGGRLRYRLRDNHKLGVEAYSLFKYPDSTSLMIGYYGKFSRNVTLKLVAGSKINSGQQRAARAEIVWQIH